jgi:hypothetical protein
MAVGAQHREAGGQLGVAIEQPPAVAGQVEVLLVVERLEERGRVVRVGILVALHDELRLREELGAAGVIVVQVRDHDEIDVVVVEPEGVEPVDQEIFVREARERIVAHQARHRARRDAGVEQHVAVGGLDQPARDGNLGDLLAVLAVEQQRALRAHEPVLQCVERLDGHAARVYTSRRWAQDTVRRAGAAAAGARRTTR